MKYNEEWVTKGIDENAVIHAKEMASELASKGISTSQIRNVFGEIKKIQALGAEKDKGRSRLHMLGPKIAYAIGRMDSGRDAPKRDSFSKLLNEVEMAVGRIAETDHQKRFDNFVEYMEAIVAYHRFTESEKKSKR